MTPGRSDPALRLEPMSRGMQRLAMVAFFALGVLLAWFVFANPLDLPFLPGAQRGAVSREADDRADEVSLYQCPMHPEVIEPEPGNCPICFMPLVEIEDVSRDDDGASSERGILHWYDPMDPTFVSDEPGLSPLGLKLVPKYADAKPDHDAGVITIDPVQVQNIGVVSVAAETRDVARQSRTVGILDFNAEQITWVNTKFEGWIERVHVNYVGQDVTRGQPLFEIYSPELVTTQEEYLRALDYRASLENSGRTETLRQAEALVRSTRQRLTYWDIAEQQIAALEQGREIQRRLTITSPADGVVSEIMSEALEGMFVKPGMNLYKIADLSTVWVHADIYEVDIPWIRDGQPAAVSFRNDPGQQFRGRVLFLYPEVSRDTRTLKICVEVPNPGRRLRPGMYADVIVQGPEVRKAVVVPQSAVIRSGQRNIVFVDLGEGRFQPREVKIGVKGEGDLIQIVEGVATGDAVVTQAQFMLDSESRMQEAIAQFRERGTRDSARTGDEPSSGHAH